MLVLTRRIGECIKIGENIYITIVGLRGAQIKLGIDAPLSVSIDRCETYLKAELDFVDQGINAKNS